MKVLLVDVDSKIPNLALMKISAWHKLNGDDVGFNIENPDKVYISCIFKKNAGQAKGISSFYLPSGSDEGAREDPAIYGGDEVPPASSCTKHVSNTL